MKNNAPKTINLKTAKVKKLPQLQQLRLEELEQVAGGPAGDGCPWCIFSQ